MAIAAPAMAASGCKLTTGLLSWDVYADNSPQTGHALATSGGTGVTVTISLSGATGADNNGNVTSTSTGGDSKVLRFYDVNGANNTSQTITLSFNKPVQNLSFSLLDVDSAQQQGKEAGYEDLVIVNTTGFTATKHANVKGSGTAAAPFRAVNTNSPVAGSSADSNVDLAWTGPISSVSFTYAQDGTVNGTPFIGMSDLSFQYCL